MWVTMTACKKAVHTWNIKAGHRCTAGRMANLYAAQQASSQLCRNSPSHRLSEWHWYHWDGLCREMRILSAACSPPPHSKSSASKHHTCSGSGWMRTWRMVLHDLFLFMCVCVSMQRPEGGIRFAAAGVTGSCELLDVGTGNGTWVL